MQDLRVQGAEASTELEQNGSVSFTVELNEEKGFVLKFSRRLPSERFKEITQDLKKNGWRYSPEDKVWFPYGKAKEKASEFVMSLYQSYGKSEEPSLQPSYSLQEERQHVFKDYLNFNKTLGVYPEIDTDYATSGEIADYIGRNYKNDPFLSAAAKRIKKEYEQETDLQLKVSEWYLKAVDCRFDKENTADNFFHNFQKAAEKHINWQEKLLSNIVSNMNPQEKEKVEAMLSKRKFKNKEEMFSFIMKKTPEKTRHTGNVSLER